MKRIIISLIFIGLLNTCINSNTISLFTALDILYVTESINLGANTLIFSVIPLKEKLNIAAYLF